MYAKSPVFFLAIIARDAAVECGNVKRTFCFPLFVVTDGCADWVAVTAARVTSEWSDSQIDTDTDTDNRPTTCCGQNKILHGR